MPKVSQHSGNQAAIQASRQAALHSSQVAAQAAARQVRHSAQIAIYATLTKEVKRFHDRLLESAQKIIDDSDADEGVFAAAITLAGTACEVAVEATVGTFIAEKNLGAIAEAANDWVRTYNLKEEKIRTTWNAITGDEIQNESFWTAFTEHVKRRNSITHTATVDGTILPTKQDAQASIDVAKDLSDHIKALLTSNGLGSFA